MLNIYAFLYGLGVTLSDGHVFFFVIHINTFLESEFFRSSAGPVSLGLFIIEVFHHTQAHHTR